VLAAPEPVWIGRPSLPRNMGSASHQYSVSSSSLNRTAKFRSTLRSSPQDRWATISGGRTGRLNGRLTMECALG
jgi:hypothetical protein